MFSVTAARLHVTSQVAKSQLCVYHTSKVDRFASVFNHRAKVDDLDERIHMRPVLALAATCY